MSQASAATLCMVTLTQFVTVPGAHEIKFQLPFQELPNKERILEVLSGESNEPNAWTALVENMEDVDILDYQDAYEVGDLEFECYVDGDVVGTIVISQWPVY